MQPMKSDQDQSLSRKCSGRCGADLLPTSTLHSAQSFAGIRATRRIHFLSLWLGLILAAGMSVGGFGLVGRLLAADETASAATVAGTNAVPAVASLLENYDDRQKLAIGDSVSFRVLEDQEPAKTLVVSDSGELDIPDLGLIAASGKTCKQLAAEIKGRLEQTTYYRATLVLGIQQLNKTMSGRRVYVSGQVRRNGPQEIPAGESWTVSKAVLNAGGFTEFADMKNVRLVRNGARGEPSKTFIINVSEILKRGKTEQDIPVETEDLIYVPTRHI